jgi:hypothetical protein
MNFRPGGGDTIGNRPSDSLEAAGDDRQMPLETVALGHGNLLT